MPTTRAPAPREGVDVPPVAAADVPDDTTVERRQQRERLALQVDVRLLEVVEARPRRKTRGIPVRHLPQVTSIRAPGPVGLRHRVTVTWCRVVRPDDLSRERSLLRARSSAVLARARLDAHRRSRPRRIRPAARRGMRAGNPDRRARAFVRRGDRPRSRCGHAPRRRASRGRSRRRQHRLGPGGRGRHPRARPRPVQTRDVRPVVPVDRPGARRRSRSTTCSSLAARWRSS